MWVHSRCGLQVGVGPHGAFVGRLRDGRLPHRPASLATGLNRQLPGLDSHQQATGPPRRTLPHTAFRHRSPKRMRCPVPHPSAEAIDPQIPQPGPGEAVGPVAVVTEAVLDAGEDGQALVDVAVDPGELPRGVAVAESGRELARWRLVTVGPALIPGVSPGRPDPVTLATTHPVSSSPPSIRA